MAKIKSRKSADVFKMLESMGSAAGQDRPANIPPSIAHLGDSANPISAAQAEELGKLRSIDIALLDADPNQPRRTFDAAALEDLQKTIAAVGRLIHPPVVRPNKSQPGRFLIIAGERRVRACRALGWTQLDCCVEESIADNDVLLLQLVENSEKARQHVLPVEEALAIQKLVELLGSAKAAGEAIGHSKSYVSKRLALLSLKPEILERLKTNTLSDYETATALQRLSEVDTAAYDQLMGLPLDEPIRRAVVTDAIKAASARLPGDQSPDQTVAIAKSKLALGLSSSGIGPVKDIEVKRAGGSAKTADNLIVRFRLNDLAALHALIDKLGADSKAH